MSARRPRKTAKQWEKLIEQQDTSGMSIAEFCKQRDVALSTFSKWHRKFKIGLAPATSTFKQVKVSKPMLAQVPAPLGSVISLQIGTDIVLTIHSGEPLS